MKHGLSASGIARARRCLWWARGDIELPTRQPSRAAKLGTAVHRAIELKLGDDVRTDHLYDDIDDDQIAEFDGMVKQWGDWWPTFNRDWQPFQWRAEVAVAWDVKSNTARPLPRTEHRDYGVLSDYEVPGTVDLAGVGDEWVAAVDWKTGRQTVESPATNPQLAHNGAALAAWHQKPGASVTYVKLSPDAVYVAQPASLDVFSFEATRDELRTMLDAIPTSNPEPGPWCHWCPAKGVCAETATAVEQVIDATALVRRVPISLTIRDNDHAAGMLSAVDAVESFIGELKKRLRNYADANGGIALPDGTVYQRTDVTTERPDLSVDGASDALANAGLEAAIKESVTWEDIKRVGGKDGENRARALLRSMGATKVAKSPRYEAKAKKGGRAA